MFGYRSKIKSIFLITILMVFITICFGGCKKIETDDFYLCDTTNSVYEDKYIPLINKLESYGIVGIKPLQKLSTMNTIEGYITGSFLLGTGSIRGKIAPVINIIFVLGQNPVIGILPIEKINIIYYDGKPSIRIKYNLHACLFNGMSDLPPTNYIRDKNVIKATLYINKDDLENNVYTKMF